VQPLGRDERVVLRAVNGALLFDGAYNEAVHAETLASGPVAAQVALVDRCATFAGAGERAACFSWLARALTVATDGRFAGVGCAQVVPAGRKACRAGARAWREPLETFT